MTPNYQEICMKRALDEMVHSYEKYLNGLVDQSLMKWAQQEKNNEQ